MSLRLDRPRDFDLATLREALAGRVPKLGPGAALTLLRGKRFAGAAAMIRAAFEDRRRDAGLRAHAGELLSRGGGDLAEDAFLTALGDPSPRVRMTAIKGLGRVGRHESLQALARIAAGDDLRAARQAGYSARLIAARQGLPLDLPAPPTPAIGIDEDCAEQLQVRRAAVEEAIEAIRALEDDPVGLAYEPGNAVWLSGIALKWLLVLDARRFALTRCGHRHALLGCVAEWDGSDDRWHHQYTLIADPETNPGYRPLGAYEDNGDVALTGWLELSRGRGRFDLAAACKNAVPAALRGRVAGRAVVIERALAMRRHHNRATARLLRVRSD